MTTQSELNFDKGSYKVIDILGRGQYSTVYRVYDTKTDERVALKILGVGEHDKDIAQAMFLKEVTALTNFHNPSVVKLLGHFIEPEYNMFGIALELVPRAITLETFIREVNQKRRAAPQVEWVLEQHSQTEATYG